METATTRAIEELREALGERLATGEAVREHHAGDESWHERQAPAAVVFAESAEDVAAAVAICAKHHVPMIPFGTGTGLEGGTVGRDGAVSIDVSRMDAIVSVNAEDMDCVVQPGVTRGQLNRYLRDTGLFFPVDPGADASLGGMAATRASGTNAVRYGTMRENVLSLKVVTPDGRLVTTGQRARKSAAGYDLTRLFVGSEGTLGIIVELTVRLHGRPEAISAARVCFDNVSGAVDAVILTIQSGIPIARMELIDAEQMRAINAYSKTDYPEQVTLFLEFHGSEASVREQAECVGEICDSLGGSGFQWTAFEEERSRMWEARHHAAYAAMAVRPGARAYATDVCVPISRLAECIRETRADVHAHTQIPTFLLGHVGDGNFHYVFLVDPEDPEELDQVHGLSGRMVERALAMGGTCTGEHGIGLGKQAYLQRELGPDAVDLMRTLKGALDPGNLMNPGKLLPD
ncbi:FAD-binding oxidoreductase [Elongatibacter sediminis]|uniref:D-lactate dehydrogenase (cytochrome) n=1 Tax=Elongatibacter sediminis TaxID=3119006 RepID=A0AAW9R8U7_9GAMM